MPAKSRQEKPKWFRIWLFKSAILLSLVVLFIVGIIAAGRWGDEYLRGRERYDLPFTDIDCNPPVGMERKTFLEQVRYYASPPLPERVNVLDEQLLARLRDGFAKHPWVEKVDAIDIKPPHHVSVKLTHRTPALAVKFGKDVFAVDRSGILLPRDAPTLGLPVYDIDAPEPKGVGQRWGDANVEEAARKSRK
ncbi:MAG TPA: hypothetical protein VFE62_03920 [Gemmataceae bacterium]|nr:hypothetical protein [Gemmataceae bacterium]